ncbi:integrating conjugative element protein [Gilvimarinus polysaccharolyticus]|uniref:integrating conjugative element protein n=1 Tax=Gilvimarinus polysaccharolyticus TaxID=863921 RepID=UPI000673AC6B|nr:integrating conjugative element protein [Gilvimarinus polysaccharolyticus]
MRTIIKRVHAIVLAATFIGAPAIAADIDFANLDIRPVDNSALYYNIGGGEPYLFAYDKRYHLNLGVGFRWSAGNVCTGFDPKASIKNTLRDTERSLYGYVDDVIASIPTLVASWGISKLQEANPGIYDLITKGLVDAKEEYNLSVKSCEAMTNDVANGENPVDGWVSIGTRDSWNNQASEPDAGQAEETVERTAGNEGIQGPGGVDLGGRYQEPIRTVGDVVGAGYDHLNPASTERRIENLWSHRDDAVDWVTSVVGEKEVKVCKSCSPKLKTKIGQGLRTKIKEEREYIAPELGALVGMSSQPTKDELDNISAPGMGIMVTEDLIRALREESSTAERSILGARLATELALARTVEKALVSMDLIKAGRQEPNVAANAEYQKEADKVLARLQSEIDGILYEQNVKQRVFAKTAQVLMERRSARMSSGDAGAAIGRSASPDIQPFSGGVRN